MGGVLAGAAAKRGSFAPVALALLAAIVCLLALAPRASAEVETLTMRSQKITVNGFEVKNSLIQIPKPAVAGHVTHMSVDLVDADGLQIPIRRLMLHHIVFLSTGGGDPTCGSFLSWDSIGTYPAIERFYAAGEERAEMDLPDGYGYRVQPAQSSWNVNYMVMNHRPEVDEAYIQYTVTYRTGADDVNTKDVHPYWFDAANCKADPIYNVPGTGGKNSSNVRSMDFRMPDAGRIVGTLGHVHGGAKRLRLVKPECESKTLVTSDPTWGFKQHPFYQVRPILHEPGPIHMTETTSETGIPVARNELLRLNSLYDNSLPHTRVMGIMVIYVADDAGVTQKCGALPGDLETIDSSKPGRPGPIPFTIPLTERAADGSAKQITKITGKETNLKDGSQVEVTDLGFGPRKAVVRQGARLTYKFDGYVLHNLTLANGPKGIGTPNMNLGRTTSVRFSKPGTYQFFCGIHPVDMHEQIRVLKPGRRKSA